MAEYRGLNDPAQVVAYIRAALDGGGIIGADTETMGANGENTQTAATDRWHALLVGFSVSARWGEAIYVPIRHEDEKVNCPLTDELRAILIELATCGRTAWHGAHFDAAIFCRFLGIPVADFRAAHCTLLMAQCLGERSEAGSDRAGGLKPLAKKYLGVERPSFKDLWPEKTKDKDRRFAALDLDTAVPYAAADADDVQGLVQAFLPLLEHWQVTATDALEKALLPEILWMEDRGVLLNEDYASECSAQLTRFAAEATERIYEALRARLGREPTVTIQRMRKPKGSPAGTPSEPVMVTEPVSLTSNDSLAALLFDDPDGLGYPRLKTTAKGKASVDEEVLERLAVQEEWLGWLLEVRSADKARGTYFDTFASYCLPEIIGGVERLVLHPNYKQFGAETGRTASDRPNVQNLPKEQKIGARKDGTWVVPGVEPVTVNTRDMLIPRPGYYFVDMDWAAVEYRIIAGFSQDPGLIETFRRGIDIHVATYALMYGVDPATVDGEQRGEGKTTNYCLAFGGGPERLAGMLGCSVEDARVKIGAYNAGMPLVHAWKVGIEEFAKTNKYVQTIIGRKRWLHFGGQGISEKLARQMYFAALREAVNCPVQGTAADLLKITLVKLGPWLRQYFPTVRTVLTTHDSITFEVPLEIPAEHFITSTRPVVEYPWDWQPGWPAITADFVHGEIGWGSLKELAEDDDEAVTVVAEVAPQAPVSADLAPPPSAGPRELHLRCLETVTVAQVTALNQFLQARGGQDILVLAVPNDGGQVFPVPGVGITPGDRAQIAELTGWVQFHLEWEPTVAAAVGATA